MSGSTVTAVVEKLPASKVKEISMMLSTDENKEKNMVLVEGPDDKTFYAYYVSENDVVFNVLKGCYYMPTILALVNKDTSLRDRVIGIKDADFDRVTGKTYSQPNLFLTDTHDWETMTLTEESEHNVAIEALNRSEKGLFGKVMKAVVTAVTASVATMVGPAVSNKITGKKSRSTGGTKGVAGRVAKNATSAATRQITRSLLGSLMK